MSKINQLIQNLCPAGVEYKKLEDVLTIKNGRDYKQFGDGDVPVYGSGGIMTYINTAVYDKPSVLIPRKGSLDKLYYVDTPFWNVDTIFYTDIDTSLVEPKYIYYYLEGQHLERLNKAGGVPSLTQAVLNKVQLPVPPLEVQCEIVHILDKFTELTAELTAKLTAEFTARKKQYEFYRDELLTFDDTVEMVTLQDICKKICSGGTPKSTNKDYYGGDIPWLRTQEVDWNDIYDTGVKITQEGLDNSSAKWIPKNCLIIAMYGATAAKAAINRIPLTTNQACCNLEINNEIADLKYVFHWMSKEYINLKEMGQGSQSNINAGIIRNYPIPLPSLAEQKRIADILDKFYALVKNMDSGIPAEIQARNLQYNYYRSKLLTFKKK